jgi:hypothetical protein
MEAGHLGIVIPRWIRKPGVAAGRVFAVRASGAEWMRGTAGRYTKFFSGSLYFHYLSAKVNPRNG